MGVKVLFGRGAAVPQRMFCGTFVSTPMRSAKHIPELYNDPRLPTNNGQVADEPCRRQSARQAQRNRSPNRTIDGKEEGHMAGQVLSPQCRNITTLRLPPKSLNVSAFQKQCAFAPLRLLGAMQHAIFSNWSFRSIVCLRWIPPWLHFALCQTLNQHSVLATRVVSHMMRRTASTATHAYLWHPPF